MSKRKNSTRGKFANSAPVSPSLDAVWYGERFPTDFVYDRPFGGDDVIHFFHFRNKVVLLDGEGESAREGGCAILYAPGSPQRFSGEASLDRMLLCDHVCFAPEEKGRMTKLGIPLDRVFKVTNPQAVMDSVLNLRTEEQQAQPHWRSVARAYRTILILQLAREATKKPAPRLLERDARVEETVHNVCAMIDRNPAHPWVVAELARTVGMSRGRFSAQFKQYAGVTPQEYAILARLREARMLLTNSSLSVGEVADRCGFSSAYYLSRLFSKRIGCPPSRYAERYRVSSS